MCVCVYICVYNIGKINNFSYIIVIYKKWVFSNV